MKLKILHTGTGTIGENDVSLAIASGAIVIGFNVEVDEPGRRLGDSEGVDIRKYSIIYKLTDSIEIPVPDVKQIRERYALSQSEFAALLGVSIKTLQNWEQGRRAPHGAAPAFAGSGRQTSASGLGRGRARYPGGGLTVCPEIRATLSRKRPA